jgi:hypothetical protein
MARERDPNDVLLEELYYTDAVGAVFRQRAEDIRAHPRTHYRTNEKRIEDEIEYFRAVDPHAAHPEDFLYIIDDIVRERPRAPTPADFARVMRRPG